MSGINRVTLIGNLGDDPACTSTANGQTMARIRLATSERWRDKQTGERRESTEWHRLVFFGPVAETAQQYLRKGAKVYIEGKLRTRKWQDEATGQDRYSTEIVVGFPDGKMLMLDRNGTTNQQTDYKPQQRSNYKSSSQQQQPLKKQPTQQTNDDAPFNDSLDDLDAPMF